MEKIDAVGSVHLAINTLVSALHGIRATKLIPDESLAIELGEDRVFVLKDGMVICKPSNFMNIDAIPFGDLNTAIKVIDYPPREEGSSGGSRGSGSSEAPAPHPETGKGGGERECPVCLGTGKLK